MTEYKWKEAAPINIQFDEQILANSLNMSPDLPDRLVIVPSPDLNADVNQLFVQNYDEEDQMHNIAFADD